MLPSLGTAKTTICEALAQRIGWDFVVIDTSVFLEDGLSNVASRIRYVFGQLQSLRRTVILFDEIEEFCLDREAPGIGMESRMLTTAMLTAINDLRRAKRSMFFLATNRLRGKLWLTALSEYISSRCLTRCFALQLLMRPSFGLGVLICKFSWEHPTKRPVGFNSNRNWLMCQFPREF